MEPSLIFFNLMHTDVHIWELKQGILRNRIIAVKRLSNSHTIEDRMFDQELQSLMRVKHQNIVQFLGYCSHTEEHALEYSGNLFFLTLSSGYSCSILYMHEHTPTQPRTHHTHTTRAQLDLQLHTDLKTASFLRSPGPSRLRRRRAHRNPFVAPHVRGYPPKQGINPWGEAPGFDSKNRTQNRSFVPPRTNQPS
jgi:hypothetical protein